MKCYFCQKELEARADNKYISEPCVPCTETNNLSDVITVVNPYHNTYMYAHIYLDGGDMDYHIRLDIQAKDTQILGAVSQEHFTYKNVAKLPGFPLRPDNIHQKLKLYILFS